MMEEEWKVWDRLGLFPGEEETEESFINRVQFCVSGPLQNREEPFLQYQHLKNQGVALAEELYGISPSWVPLLFSDHRLMPWHGGCTWIFQEKTEDPLSAFIQLRALFLKQDRLWGVYSREEIVAHELAHVGRMAYISGNHYEELLAYEALSSGWRRFLGPIVQSSWEALLFIFSLGGAVVAQVAPIWLGQDLPFWVWTGCTVLPFLLVFLGMARLLCRRRILRVTLQHLQELVVSHKKARHLLYRLTDKEVKLFSRESPAGILSWIAQQQQHSFRWRFFFVTQKSEHNK